MALRRLAPGPALDAAPPHPRRSRTIGFVFSRLGTWCARDHLGPAPGHHGNGAGLCPGRRGALAVGLCQGGWSRRGGAASTGWGLGVWVFGETFGGILTPGLTWLDSAPGGPFCGVRRRSRPGRQLLRRSGPGPHRRVFPNCEKGKLSAWPWWPGRCFAWRTGSWSRTSGFWAASADPTAWSPCHVVRGRLSRYHPGAVYREPGH